MEVDIPSDLKDLNPQVLVKYSEDLGKRFARGNNAITTSQLRNVFSDIKRIQLNWKGKKMSEEELVGKLQLLKPKLAYAAGKPSQRKKRDAIKKLKKELEKAIDSVVTSEDIPKAADNFFALVEAIVAYHKFHGGK